MDRRNRVTRIHPRHATRLARQSALAGLLLACSGETAHPAGDSMPQPDAAPPPIELIDPAIPPAVAGENGWNYQQSASADLTGDGRAERVVLTARVELYRGRPAWDDGQPWQVYVEDPGGARTYLYTQRLQLGTLTMRVSRVDSTGAATVLLLEHLPDRLGLYEIAYRGPDSTQVVGRFERNLDPRGDLASPRLP